MEYIDGDIDVESGITDMSDSGSSGGRTSSSGGGGVKVVKLQKKPIRMNISLEQVKQFERDYEIAPILSSSLGFHMHPHLAHQRNALELAAMKLAIKLGTVCDVGSAARVARVYSSQVHCMVPIIQPGDLERLAAARVCRASLCEHRLQDCTCGPFDSLLMVHSAYYFSYAVLKNALSTMSRTRSAFVVGHEFPEGYGHFAYGEGSYELRGTDDEEIIVITKVRGNHHVYTHPPLLWAINETPGDADSHLDVQLLQMMGDTKLWKITLMAGPAPQAVPASWKDQIADTKHMGPIQIPGYPEIVRMTNQANEIRPVNYDIIYGFGKFLYKKVNTRMVIFPRGLIEKTAFTLMGKPRSPALYADTIHIIKNEVGFSRLPPDMQLTAATIAVAIAFTCNVKLETEVAMTAQTRFDWLWALHARATTLQPLRILSIWTFILWAGILLTVVLILGLSLPYQHHVVGVLGIVLWTIGVLVIFSVYAIAECWRKRMSHHWGHQLYHEGRATNITGLVDNQPVRTLFPANSALRAPLIPPSGARMDVGRDDATPKHPGRMKTPLILSGAAFSTTVPSVVADTQSADIVALTHRVLRAATKVDQTALEAFHDLSSTEAGRALLSIRLVMGDAQDEFDNWVRQPKFNEGQRQRFMKYWDKFKGKYPPRSIFRSFVKIEKNKTHTVVGPPLMKPRLVSGPWDAVKAMVGWAVAKTYTAVREAWDGVHSPILYASGMTPDSIGAICDNFAEQQGGWQNIIGVWWDFVAYDSTVQNELLQTRESYLKWGWPQLAFAWLMSPKNAGVTKHGVKYNLGKKMIEVDGEDVEVEMRVLYSGEMDTNLVGTLVNGKAAASGIKLIEATTSRKVRYLLLVCGDDGMMFVNQADWSIDNQNAMKTHFDRLGLEVGMGCSPHRHDWEFCSKLFWWGKDPRTGKLHTVLGPKVGRLAHRLAFNLTLPGAQNLRGAVISLASDTAHIPLLNSLIKKLLNLTAGQKEKGKPEHSEIKHVSKVYNMVPENLTLLQERYGLSYEHLTQFDSVLRGVTTLPCVLNFPWIEGMVKRDE